jgi:hypothetical protein
MAAVMISACSAGGMRSSASSESTQSLFASEKPRATCGP